LLSYLPAQLAEDFACVNQSDSILDPLQRWVRSLRIFRVRPSHRLDHATCRLFPETFEVAVIYPIANSSHHHFSKIIGTGPISAAVPST
jgi:hypothetical protein